MGKLLRLVSIGVNDRIDCIRSETIVIVSNSYINNMLIPIKTRHLINTLTKVHDLQEHMQKQN